MYHPQEAIVAVTLNCNARCVMCNIWQNKIKGEVEPNFYEKLPSSLREINITGGEPFLRKDLPDIVKVIKKRCQKARLLINTNGYLVNQIKQIFPKVLKEDPYIAMRVSIDGTGDTHTHIRGLPLFYENAITTLNYFKEIGVKDIGISFTLMEQNKHELLKLYDMCEKNDFEFSLTVASDSPIYFGKGKIKLRPKIDSELKDIFDELIYRQITSNKPKDWFRGWFSKKLDKFIQTNTRHFTCDAGSDFFYVDSLGKVYTCHLKPWLVGDLNKIKFEDLHFNKFISKIKSCNDCWMVCSARTNIRKNILAIFKDIFIEKAKFLREPYIKPRF
ncbi:MAG: radical SAM protein [Candidatus Roizmanbacteria bacterium]|nr:radical SAM protein [Candidatus Roizmanbacteria bacterium]